MGYGTSRVGLWSTARAIRWGEGRSLGFDYLEPLLSESPSLASVAITKHTVEFLKAISTGFVRALALGGK